jgi:hypothetical protein
MYMKLTRVIAVIAVVAAAGIAVFGGPGSATLSAGTPSFEPDSITGRDDSPPSSEDVEFAKATSDLLHNELVAALFKEFDETTVNNAENGKQAISQIFNNSNRDIRLIGVFSPVLGGINDLPSDSFERRSLMLALQGANNESVERVGDRWYYRTSLALSNTFHTSCVLCHTNFTDSFFERTHNDGQWVGALVTRVPIGQD